MTLIAAVSWLYSLSGLVTVAGYLPQIAKLIGATGRSVAVSLLSWWLWLGVSLTGLGYGMLVLQDWRFILLAGLHLCCETIVIALVMYNRYARFEVRGFAFRQLWRDATSAVRWPRLAQPD